MVRKVENGTQGFSAKNATAKPTNKRKQSAQQPIGFGDVADLGDLIPVEGQQQETTPATTKTEEQVIESKQEAVSNENKEQTEEPTTESEKDSDGNNDKELVEEHEGSEGESTPTDVEEEETPTGEEKKSDDDNEEEEIMTQVKTKTSIKELFEEVKEPEKELKGYMIEKELIKALEKHGKKIPRKHGGVSALVNRLLRDGLMENGMLEEKKK